MIICYNFSVRISREMPRLKPRIIIPSAIFSANVKKTAETLSHPPTNVKNFAETCTQTAASGPPSAAATPNVRGTVAIENMPRARLNTLVTVFFSGGAAAVLRIAPLRPF